MQILCFIPRLGSEVKKYFMQFRALQVYRLEGEE
jgi:hypothetical protein